MNDDAKVRPSADEALETSRADLYGLLAALWMAAPDEEMLKRLQSAEQPGEAAGHLHAPWQALVSAMRAASRQALADEYDALFQGVGKPAVFLSGSYYVAGFLNERPLVVLRDELRELGLERDPARLETEDHVSFVFEVMRYLIAGDDVSVCNLERQRRFFRAHIQPWIGRLCDAVEAQPQAAAWRAVAGLTRAYMEVEAQGFDMLET